MMDVAPISLTSLDRSPDVQHVTLSNESSFLEVHNVSNNPDLYLPAPVSLSSCAAPCPGTLKRSLAVQNLDDPFSSEVKPPIAPVPPKHSGSRSGKLLLHLRRVPSDLQRHTNEEDLSSIGFCPPAGQFYSPEASVEANGGAMGAPEEPSDFSIHSDFTVNALDSPFVVIGPAVWDMTEVSVEGCSKSVFTAPYQPSSPQLHSHFSSFGDLTMQSGNYQDDFNS